MSTPQPCIMLYAVAAAPAAFLSPRNFRLPISQLIVWFTSKD